MNCLNKKSRIIKASACAYPIFNNENMIIGMLVTLKHNVDSEVSNNAYLKNYQDLEAFPIWLVTILNLHYEGLIF